VLRAGAFLQFSILHPCFFTPHRRVLRNGDGVEYALEISRYFERSSGEIDEWIFTGAPAAVSAGYPKFKIPMFHRTLSDWMNTIVAAGFSIEHVEEPHASAEVAERYPVVRDTRLVPYFLHVRCRKG
jgi:hypothetical protein